MGRLELPLPELRDGPKALEAAARNIQARIREQAPVELKRTIVVKVFRDGQRTGIAIEYDDRAENLVYAAMEYPREK